MKQTTTYFGRHPMSGNLLQSIKIVSAHPRIYLCRIIGSNRIYHANYSQDKILRKFEPLTQREFKRLAKDRIQMTLFELAEDVAAQ